MKQKTLRKSLLAAIVAVSFTAIVLCVVCFALMFNSIGANTEKQAKEASDLLIGIVLNGFVQSEGASLDYALKHAYLAIRDNSFRNDDDLIFFGYSQLYNLLNWDRELEQYFFVARSGEITAALAVDVTRESSQDAPYLISTDEMTRMLIDADVPSMSYYDVTLEELLMPEYCYGAIYSSEDENLPLMVMVPIGEDDVFGMFLPHAQSFRLIEALYEVADDTRAINDSAIREISMKYILILVTVVIGLLGIIALISYKLSLAIAQPVEREKEIMEQINILKTEFLANISHELKTPLTIIGGHAQHGQTVLKDIPGAEDTERSLKLIASEADRLALMVSQILDLSQIEEGRMKFNMKPCSIMEIISQVLDVYYPVFTKNHNMLKVSPSAPPPVLCDAHRITQVLVNLISNAAKNTRDGTITISATERQGDIEVTVEDTGEGIPPEIMETIFDRYRIKNPKDNTGTGLGLCISRHIAEAHGGKLTLKSELGKGTIASFTLPLS